MLIHLLAFSSVHFTLSFITVPLVLLVSVTAVLLSFDVTSHFSSFLPQALRSYDCSSECTFNCIPQA